MTTQEAKEKLEAIFHELWKADIWPSIVHRETYGEGETVTLTLKKDGSEEPLTTVTIAMTLRRIS